MIQFFYPAKTIKNYNVTNYAGSATAPYLEAILQLPTGTLVPMKSNSHLGAPIIPSNELQLVVLSQGYFASRKVYTTLIEDLASHGYLVVAIDHPYDAAIVEFPDGRTALLDPTANMSDPAIVGRLLEARVKDTLFTLDLIKTNLTTLIPGAKSGLRIRRTGMMGHSSGGAIISATMLVDNRIQGGTNLDGNLFGPVIESGLDKPFVMMGTRTHNVTSEVSWISFWPNLRGWRRELVIDGTEYLMYADVGVLFKLLGVVPPADMAALLGTIDPYRAMDIQRAYILEFCDFLLRGKGDTLYDGPSEEYLEVVFSDDSV